MEKEKKSSGLLVGILMGIIISLVICGCLIFTGVIRLETNAATEKETVEEKETGTTTFEEVTFNDEKIAMSDMIQEGIYIDGGSADSDYNNYNYSVDLYYSGKVKISTYKLGTDTGEKNESFISNVDNIVDIIKLGVADIGGAQLIYMLTSDGDVYYYQVGDSKENKFVATKVDSVSNVTRLFIYSYPPRENAGASWAIVAVKKDGETVLLKSSGV